MKETRKRNFKKSVGKTGWQKSLTKKKVKTRFSLIKKKVKYDIYGKTKEIFLIDKFKTKYRIITLQI